MGRLAAVALVWLLPAITAAQYRVASFDPSTRELRCDEVGPVSPSCPGCAAPEICREVAADEWLCAEGDALFCVPIDPSMIARCPAFAPRGITLPSGLTLCVPETATVCERVDLVSCFVAPDGTAPVPYEAGDCDSDGLVNRTDGDPCVRYPRLAIATPGGSCTPLEPCHMDSDCAPPFDSCNPVRADEPQWYCVPGGEELAFCCGGFIGLECPSNVCTGIETPDDFGFCEDPRYCGGLGWGFTRRVACIGKEDDFPVTPDEGDCDGDGVANVEDPAPCVAEMNVDAGAPDAGARDAGPEPVEDAGPPPGDDAGPPVGAMDGGAPPPTAPRFGGGGGCRCGAVAPGAPATWPLLLLVAFALRRSATAQQRSAREE